MIFSKKTNEKFKYLIAGATIRGKSHVKVGKPNQDSILIYKYNKGVILSAADGVGSNEYSHYGSKAAVNAVKHTFVQYTDGKVERKNITSTIYDKYCNSIKSKYIDKAATTCIFVAMIYEQGIFVGQIGDGLCYVNINDFDFVIKPKDEEFSNIVVAMNPISGQAKWKTKFFKITDEDEFKILISSDGVSNSIKPGQENECLSYYLKDINQTISCFANMKIKKHLKNWNVKGENDDKSMIVFSRGNAI